MNPLIDYQNTLIDALLADPVLALAYTVSLFDPLWADDLHEYYAEDDPVHTALHVLRKAFPVLYLDALQAMQANATYAELETLICDGVQAAGIPVESLEWLGYGIPLPAYGAVWEDETFAEMYPQALPVLACFADDPDDVTTIPDEMHTRAQNLAETLITQEDIHWQQVAWTIRWLFSCTGNSSVDYDFETMSEFQPLMWEPDDLAFARDIIEEADGIMSDALAGLQYLHDNPDQIQLLKAKLQPKGKPDVTVTIRSAQRDERAA